MSKRSKSAGGAPSVGQGQAMQLTHRLPTLPDPPTLSETAKRRLQAVEFSLRHGVPLACEAFQVSRSTLYRWRQRYQPHQLETLEPRSRAPKRKRAVRWTWEDEQQLLKLREQHGRWGKRKLLPLLREQGCTLSEATIGRILRRLKHSGRLNEPRSVRTQAGQLPAAAARRPAPDRHRACPAPAGGGTAPVHRGRRGQPRRGLRRAHPGHRGHGNGVSR